MVDLTTTYLGLTLKNPLVASASPLSQKMNTVRQLEESGIAAIVMHSLFEEQIIQESLRTHQDLIRGTEAFAEALDYFPKFGVYSIGPDSYVNHLRNIKLATEIPIIGSLNGVSTGGWMTAASRR